MNALPKISEINWKGKTNEEMIEFLYGSHNSAAGEQVKSALYAKVMIDHANALTESGKNLTQVIETGNKLSAKLFWLNIILGAIGAVGAFYTALQFYKGFH